MSTPDRQPLWRNMLAAYSNRWLDVELTNTDNAEGLAFAAELRVIANSIPPDLYGAGGVRLWLLEEVERAERGDE